MSNKFKNSISVIVLVVLSLLALGSLDEDPNAWKTKEDPILAYNMLEIFVEKRLKTPTEAEFAGTFEKTSHVKFLGNNTYQINSYVDSKNSFGAKLRTKFSGNIKRISEDDWELISLEIFE